MQINHRGPYADCPSRRAAFQRLKRAVVPPLCTVAFALAGNLAAASVWTVFDAAELEGEHSHDASTGSARNPSTLTLTGPFDSKLGIVSLPFAPERRAGLLEWQSAEGGTWNLTIANPAWSRKDLTGYDFLEFSFNAPRAIASERLPAVRLQTVFNAPSATVALGNFLPGGIDADSNSWQSVRIPLNAFNHDGTFPLTEFKSVHFSQAQTDSEPRTLWLERIDVISTNTARRVQRPTAPANLVVRTGDRSVALHWDAHGHGALRGYHVYRSAARAPFERLTARPVRSRSFADVNVANGQTYRYRVTALNEAGESAPSKPTAARPAPFANDDAFLDLLQQTAFDYFWYEANPTNGLVRDRSRAHAHASIAATGFGLTAIGIGIERGWITRAQGRERTLRTLKTFCDMPQGDARTGAIGHRGWFYHFLEMDTAARSGACELSSIDTALLLAGCIYAREYFDGRHAAEKEIRAAVEIILDRVDWHWMTDGADSLTMGWHPERGFLKHRWTGYNEAMILYVLGLGASRAPLPASQWQTWTSKYKWETHYGQSFVIFPPLFGHQYSHSWIDFRGIADDYMRERGVTYFENSRRATIAQREYAIANPGNFTGYGADVWGLTACDGPGTRGKFSYMARGAPPPERDDGTIAPTAAGGSIAFTPEHSLNALRHFYDQFRTDIWTGYGFRDAFNLEVNWWGPDVLGIDQGPILLMAENHRSEHVWRVFMKAPEIQRGLNRAGFRSVSEK